jgi:ribonuclease HI
MLQKPTSGWCVDASTRGNPGPSEYRCMDLETGEIVFHRKIGVATNNIAEFIGLGHAILEAIRQKKDVDIYTDSVTAMSWTLSRKTKSSMKVNKLTEAAIDFKNRILTKINMLYIDGDINCIEVSNDTGSGITVYKWFTSEWGEIPADFDRK